MTAICIGCGTVLSNEERHAYLYHCEVCADDPDIGDCFDEEMWIDFGRPEGERA
jgi:hypothetical protein